MDELFCNLAIPRHDQKPGVQYLQRIRYNTVNFCWIINAMKCWYQWVGAAVQKQLARSWEVAQSSPWICLPQFSLHLVSLNSQMHTPTFDEKKILFYFRINVGLKYLTHVLHVFTYVTCCILKFCSSCWAGSVKSHLLLMLYTSTSPYEHLLKQYTDT